MHIGNVAILRLLTLIIAAYFSLWACAPPGVIAPLTPSDLPAQNEFGVTTMVDSQYDPDILAPMGMSLYWVHPTPKVDILGIFGGGLYGMDSGYGFPFSLAAGGGVRWPLMRSERSASAVQLTGGFLWASVALPMSYRISPALYLYSAPEFGLNAAGVLRAPVGLSVALGRGVHLNLDLTAATVGDSIRPVLFQFGAGLSSSQE